MDPDWIGGLASGASALLAIGSLLVAQRANRRADVANTHAAVANERAQDALDFQRRIDDREREFRDVHWNVEPADARDRALILQNRGLSKAVDVTAVVYLGPEREAFFLGDIDAESETVISSASLSEWLSGAYEHDVFTPPMQLHWSSPLGQASSATAPGKDAGDYIVDEEPR